VLTPAGLTAREAAARLQQVGPNALPVPRHRLLRLIGRQFGGVFNLLLLVAAGITFLLGEPVDGWFILLFVVLGVSLSVFQEHKSNAAADKLRTYLLSTITVRRDGADTEVPTDRVVPGDLLRLEAGDIVPADSVVLDAWNLVVDETTFTGESVPVPKVATSGEPEDGNRLLQGVVVVRGNALAEVTATGARTRLAGISATATAVHAPSELVKGIDRISNFILVTTLITLGFVIAANLLIEGRTTDLPQLLVFAIALAVSVIPEALPLVLTFSLSRGALQFAERDVIVKRLSSVQDLGSINLLCTDKTGTITQNQLSLAASRREPGSGFDPVVRTRLAAIDLAARVPEPFDRAADASLDAAQRAEVERFVLFHLAGLSADQLVHRQRADRTAAGLLDPLDAAHREGGAARPRDRLAVGSGGCAGDWAAASSDHRRVLRVPDAVAGRPGADRGSGGAVSGGHRGGQASAGRVPGATPGEPATVTPSAPAA